jgi:hypothetical protein
MDFFVVDTENVYISVIVLLYLLAGFNSWTQRLRTNKYGWTPDDVPPFVGLLAQFVFWPLLLLIWVICGCERDK